MMKGNEQIEVEYAFPDSPAKVWRALTEPDLLAGWLMPNDIAPVVGHKFNFRTQPMGDWNGVVDCEVLEVVPQEKLVYTWNGGSTKTEGCGHNHGHLDAGDAGLRRHSAQARSSRFSSGRFCIQGDGTGLDENGCGH